MKVDKSLLTGSTAMMILSLLRGEEMYGYQMTRVLRERSNGAFELREGTLYPLLHNLEQERCVEAFEREAENGKRRRYYKITPRGLKLLEDKTAEFEYFTASVNMVLAYGNA